MDIFLDKAKERSILSMAIICPNDGCEWTGELRNKKVKLVHISINVNKQLYQHKLLFSSVEITKPQTPLKFLHVEAKAVGLIIFNFSGRARNQYPH